MNTDTTRRPHVPAAAPASRPRGTVLAALALDVVVVVVFAGIGRASHHESNPILDAVQTAWPFLAGVAVGWVLTRAIVRQLPLRVSSGWPVWVCAVVVGMVLRRLTGQGTAFAFIVVATLFLGLFLLGWRLAVGLWQRKAHA